MCIVSYLPTPDGSLITSNRDEIITRDMALMPAVYEIEGHSLMFPKDPVGGGTWIAAGQKATVCLFNGAFEAHEHHPPYRHSRGLIPIAYFNFHDPKTFVGQFNFNGIEPFSMIVFESGRLSEIKWDEQKAHLLEHDPNTPQIWSSALLYARKVREEHKRKFHLWWESDPDISSQAAMAFHVGGSTHDESGLRIRRDDGLCTVSVTSVERGEGQGSRMYYRDLVQDFQSEQWVKH